MKRKLILPLLIITSTMTITACGNDNKWDAEASSIQYGEIDENVADDNESVELTEEIEIDFTGHIEYTPEEKPKELSTESTNETGASENVENNIKLNNFDMSITEDKGYSKITVNNVDIINKPTLDYIINTVGMKKIDYISKIIDYPEYKYQGNGFVAITDENPKGKTDGQINIQLTENEEIDAIIFNDFMTEDDLEVFWMDNIKIGSTKEEVEAILGKAIEFNGTKTFYTYEDSIVKVSIEYEEDDDTGKTIVEEIIIMYK